MKNKELIKAIDREKIHIVTYKKMMLYYEKYKKFPSLDFFYLCLVEDNIKNSNSSYYDFLDLMERMMKKGISLNQIKDKFELGE